jgi:hypothetical protein
MITDSKSVRGIRAEPRIVSGVPQSRVDGLPWGAAEQGNYVSRRLHDCELAKLLYTGSRRREQNLKIMDLALERSKVDRLPSASDDDVDNLVVPGRW